MANKITEKYILVKSIGYIIASNPSSGTISCFSDIHPGDILLHEFLQPMGISQNKLARGISVPPRRINEIVLGKRAITADTALRLARYFGSSEKFWLGLQGDYDLV